MRRERVGWSDALHDAHDLGVPGRPQDGIRRAQAEGLDGAPLFALFRDHHQRRGHALRGHGGQHILAAQVRQIEVGDDQVRGILPAPRRWPSPPASTTVTS